MIWELARKKTELRKFCSIHKGRGENAQILGVLRSKWHPHLRGIGTELQARGLLDCSAWYWSQAELSITFCIKDGYFCSGLSSDISCIFLFLHQIVGKSLSASFCTVSWNTEKGSSQKRNLLWGTEKRDVSSEPLDLAYNRPENNIIWLKISAVILYHIFWNCGWGGRLQLISFVSETLRAKSCEYSDEFMLLWKTALLGLTETCSLK